MDLNRVMIIGNATRDQEVKTIPSGINVATFSVATNLRWKDKNGNPQEKVEFHNVVAWRRLGEICGQYLKKGKKVYIEGRLQTRDWVGQDGVRRYRTEIIADNVILLDSRGGSSPQTPPPPPPPEPTESPVTASVETENFEQPAGNVEENEIKVEDLPF